MSKLQSISLYITMIVLMGTIQLYGQNEPSSKIGFLNAPVLFKEGGKSFQQVVASYHSEKIGKIAFFQNGKALKEADLVKGNNRILLTFQAVNKPEKVTISVTIDDNQSVKYPVTLVPPKKWEIYFVQHSHTDIGYTRPQSEILAEHMRYIDYALDYCDQTDGLPDDAKFRWTCESSWVTREYLRSRPAVQIERFKNRIAEGCLLYTSDAADEEDSVDLGGRRII